MSRVAGVTPAETRERLLAAAADVFAARGYEGTRVADIAAAAGVSNGALYAHFGSKAGLLMAALRAHGGQVMADLLAADPDRPVSDLLLQSGRALPRRCDDRSYLAAEALISARRDKDVAELMHEYVTERAGWLGGLMRKGQASGEMDPALSPGALAHFCLLLAFGSYLLPPELHAVDEAEWSALLERVVTAWSPVPAAATQDQGAEGDTREKKREVAHGRTQEPDGCAS